LSLDEIKNIKQKIIEKGFSWSAGTTSASKEPKEMRRKYLGLVISEEEQKRTAEMMMQEDAQIAEQGKLFIYPPQWDWRNVSGKNWTTPIRDQSGCGACVAFATVAMIESGMEIFKRNPNLNPNLSEADLFFRGCGNCCARGWNFVPALDYARLSGIPDEDCFPYRSDQSKSCPDRDKRIIKIKSWKTLVGPSAAKEWISSKGPVMSGLHVYDDFFYYQGGVYRGAYGGYVGDHAVCIVGYDDLGGYWLCKNSWSTGWGDNGWLKIAYGECGMGSNFAFYAVLFTEDDDFIMPKDGRVVVRYKEKNTAMNDEVWLHSPDKKLIFKTAETAPGSAFHIGTFKNGSRLTFSLKTSDGHVYYTDQALNDDACDHIKKVQIGTSKWEFRWEDLFGLGEMDYNDVVMEAEIFSPSTEDIELPKDGRVIVRLKSRNTPLQNEFRLSSPKNISIFSATANPGSISDLGTFKAGTRLTFALKTSEGYTYYTDQIQNRDFLSHVRKVPTGSNKWELRWEDVYGLADRDYNDLIVEVEAIPTSNDDVTLLQDSRVVARMVSKSTPYSNEFWLSEPVCNKIFDCTKENIGKSFEVGSFSAGTVMGFALKTGDGKTYYTDSNLNPDARVHVIKLSLGSNKWQMRWEDLYDLKDKDYNDLVVQLTIYPKV